MENSLCIVVPFRNRENHLTEFLPHMRKFLGPLNRPYKIVVVEQSIKKDFNRAKLLNIGYHYTKGEFDNYVFHDVDMLPMDGADYSLCIIPTHIATEAEQFDYKMPYDGYFGGVTIFDKASFEAINGYANEYWGWGAEDDDCRERVIKMGLHFTRRPCRFRSLAHAKFSGGNSTAYQENLNKFNNMYSCFKDGKFTDGLSNLTYKVVKTVINEPDYVRIKVDI